MTIDLETLGTTAFTLGTTPVSIGALLCAAVLMAAAIIVLVRKRLNASDPARDNLAELLKTQTELQGRIAAMADSFSARQNEMSQTLNERLDGMSLRLGTTLTEQTRSTHENLSKLQERLAVIDAAQGNIQDLAKDVIGLQAILSNKQTRGAFGQARMEALIADALPSGSYQLQPTLSNGFRPDCTIRMPNNAPPLVIDAKFPLEAWNALKADESPEARRAATQQFRRDMEVHIRDVADKYLITGETQDTAFIFVPSESIFADIHQHFEYLVQRAHRSRVVIVSPSLLMLSVQVIQSVLKDQRMREQAHLIQGEVALLMDDVRRLDERTRKLQTHFGQAQKDIDMMLTSSDKVLARGSKIESLDFSPVAKEVASPDADPLRRVVDARVGPAKLRVVDDE